jgi:hypothetical protein
MRKVVKLRMHNVTAKPAPQYGSEMCGKSGEGTGRTEAFEMKYLRPLLGGPGAHPVSYLMDTGGSFPWGKAAGE